MNAKLIPACIPKFPKLRIIYIWILSLRDSILIPEEIDAKTVTWGQRNTEYNSHCLQYYLFFFFNLTDEDPQIHLTHNAL